MKMTTFFSILQTCGSGAWCNNNNWEKPMASLKRIGVLFQTLKKENLRKNLACQECHTICMDLYVGWWYKSYTEHCESQRECPHLELIIGKCHGIKK